MSTKTAPLTPAQLADELGTDARTARKFLRSITPRDEQPGKGSRWSIPGTAASLKAMRTKFAKFEAAQAEAKAKRDEAKNAPQAPNDADEVLDADDSLDALEGPTDDEIAALDD